MTRYATMRELEHDYSIDDVEEACRALDIWDAAQPPPKGKP